MSAEQRCAECGHTAADHPDGYLGASTWTAAEGERFLCHTDDHTCYVIYGCSVELTNSVVAAGVDGKEGNEDE